MHFLNVILAHWWWISIVLLSILGMLKLAAKKTPWVWDDRIITLLIGLIRISKGHPPV